MQKNSTQRYSEDFLSKCRHTDKEVDFLKAFEAIEKTVFAEVVSNVNSKLIKELQKSVNLQASTQQLAFLSVTPNIDSTFMQAHQIYNKQIGTNQLINHKDIEHDVNSILEFPTYTANQLDVNANSKQYYPDPPEVSMGSMPRQHVNQTNIQSIIIQSTQHYELPNPEQKSVFPRQLLNDTRNCYPLPEYIVKQEHKFEFKQKIDTMGGLTNALKPMEQSLKLNEERYFAQAPQHNYLISAMQEKQVKPQPQPTQIDVKPIYDPFNLNPQNRLISIDQQQSQIDHSYIPEKQRTQIVSEIVQVDKHQTKPDKIVTLSVLEQAKAQRQLKLKQIEHRNN